MPLHDVEALIVETATAAESLPAPASVPGRMHVLSNTSTAPVVWSAGAGTPFTYLGVNSASFTLQPNDQAFVQAVGGQWVVNGPDLNFPQITSPVRALNTDFTPHATRPVLGLYTVAIQGQTSLLAGDEGRIELRSDLGAPATPRVSFRNRTGQALGVTVGTVVVQEGVVMFLFPPGWSGRLHTVTLEAAPVYSIIRSTEIIL